MTKKLYYEDSHQDSCHATVLSCTWNEKKQCYEVVLNQTVFFPEGGGQYADTGSLGGVNVLDEKIPLLSFAVDFVTAYEYQKARGIKIHPGLWKDMRVDIFLVKKEN